MKYIYIPNLYNYEKINEKGLSCDKFLDLQIKYKNAFESILSKYINFESIDNYINSFEYNIPILNKQKDNFYSINSILKSNYIYLRNNIHIENLTNEEINYLENNNVDVNFIVNTFKKVLYEPVPSNSSVLYGADRIENIVDGDSIVFEFAFDSKNFVAVHQFVLVKKIKDNLNSFLQESINKIFNTKVTVINDNGLVNYFSNEKELKKDL